MGPFQYSFEDVFLSLIKLYRGETSHDTERVKWQLSVISREKTWTAADMPCHLTELERTAKAEAIIDRSAPKSSGGVLYELGMVKYIWK